jgi:hypothetical protein
LGHGGYLFKGFNAGLIILGFVLIRQLDCNGNGLFGEMVKKEMKVKIKTVLFMVSTVF